MATKKLVHLPKEVRARIENFWGNNPEHAAKQAFCFFLDHTKALNSDHDAVVNIGIATGVLTEQMRHASPLAFIAAFEKTILNS